jgi:hypothetical protein
MPFMSLYYARLNRRAKAAPRRAAEGPKQSRRKYRPTAMAPALLVIA